MRRRNVFGRSPLFTYVSALMVQTILDIAILAVGTVAYSAQMRAAGKRRR